MNIFSKIKQDLMIGQTVVRFITHGCMGTIHEFDFIGTIVDTILKPDPTIGSTRTHKFYKVEVEKDRQGGEKRDQNLQYEYREVPSWYLQKMGKFYIAYD